MRRGLAGLPIVLLLPGVAFGADTLSSAETQVRTGAKTDVQAQPSGADGSTLANVLANNTAPGGAGTGGVQILLGNVQTSAPTYASGNIAMPWLDTAGRQLVATNGTSLSANLAQVNGATFSATNPLFSQLTDGTTVYVGTKTGQLPSALGQTTMAGSVSVAIASNQSTIAVSAGAPSGAAAARGTPTNIASAGTTTLTCVGSLTTSTPTKLYRVIVTGAAMARCTVRYNNNGTMTNFGDVMVSPTAPTAEFKCEPGFCGLTTGTTGTQAYEASCNNFDAAAQDYACSVQYCISASGC